VHNKLTKYQSVYVGWPWARCKQGINRQPHAISHSHYIITYCCLANGKCSVSLPLTSPPPHVHQKTWWKQLLRKRHLGRTSSPIRKQGNVMFARIGDSTHFGWTWIFESSLPRLDPVLAFIILSLSETPISNFFCLRITESFWEAEESTALRSTSK